MPISRELARSLFADLTQNSAVPLAPDELVHMPGLREHGHVFLGDIAVRCYKHRARWMYDERDIRAAGRVFADMEVRLDDVVTVRLPTHHSMAEGENVEWYLPDWRRRVAAWMFDAARDKLFRQERTFSEWGAWRQVGANGLPGDLTWEEFMASRVGRRHGQNIAATRPLELLTWSGQEWLLPRAYADLLDRWEQRESEVAARARLCSSCAERSPGWLGWRTPTAQGYVTRCPPCSGAAFLKYSGHLRGVPYEKVRRRGTRADEYLCRLCKASQASVWDHCHEHGQVRGPLCGSCNSREGCATPEYFFQFEGSVEHLLECRGCNEQRSLPQRFALEVVRAHLQQTERHGQCRMRPYVREAEQQPEAGHRFLLSCSGGHTKTGTWTTDVTADEVTALVHTFVDPILVASKPLLDLGSEE
ncbi:hypothetical protein EAO73_35805 [Streptomyces sp. col6]|uniref:endonuclease domain-containing protein n=1 Tax=Streptomyces sp. col6 TaxID=2478958 RepID=UPI0011CDB2CB|nr:endonuclease domain-containing protein [Streptomyces sp. col6]TXR91750.1 hypothetical protein EAO73_35805 [Streptomyces sp. col6]